MAVEDPREQASGRTGVEPPKPQQAGVPPQSDTSYDTYTRDLAANIAQQAFKDAQQQNEQLPLNARQDVSFKPETPTLYQRVQQGAADPGVWGPLSPVVSHVMGWLGTDQSAPTQRDPYLRANYLPSGYAKQNTEIALARLIGHDPSLVRHPHLLFNAAIKDMKAHDVQRLATYADLAKAYNALIANPDGWQNAAKSALDRMNNSPSQKLLRTEGKAIDLVAKPVVNFLGNTRAKSDALFAQSVGVDGELQTDESGKTRFVSHPENSSPLGNALFTGIKAVESAPGKAMDWAFNVQHTVRALHDIKAQYGDDQYYAALATVVGTTALLGFATDGVGVVLRKAETAGLRKLLEGVGVSVDDVGLAELRKLADAAATPAKHLRYVRAVNNFIRRIPPNQQADAVRVLAEEGLAASRPQMIADDVAGNVNAYTRPGGMGLNEGEQLTLFPNQTPPAAGVAEDAATAAADAERFVVPDTNSIFGDIGNIVGRVAKSPVTKKIWSNTAGFGWKHPRVPFNFQLASELLFGTGAFGLDNNWKQSWERTKDGNTYLDPHTHRPVSLGRDVAGAMFQPDSFWYNAVSGPLDLLTQFELDPTLAFLKPLSEARRLPPLRNRDDVHNFFASNRNGRAMAEKIVAENTKANDFLNAEVAKLKANWKKEFRDILPELKRRGYSQTVIDEWRRNPGDSEIRKLVRSLHPEADSYATLARIFEPLTASVKIEGEAGHDIIGRLTEAETFDDVVEVFGDLAEANALLDPRRIAAYNPWVMYKDSSYAKVREQLLNPSQNKIVKAAESVEAKLARGLTSLKPVYFPELHLWSNKIARVGDPNSLSLLRRALLASGRRPDVVDLVINRLARTGSPEEYNAVYKNFVQDQFNADADKFVSDLVEYGNFNRYEAAVLRNALLQPFRAEIARISQTRGGGGAKSVYTGIADNTVVSKNNPFSTAGQHPTAGLIEAHEHYFALPDYTAWDNFKQEVLKGLSDPSSKSLRAQILAEADKLIGKEIDQKIQKQMQLLNDWERRLANASKESRIAEASAERVRIQGEINRLVEERAKLIEERIGGFEFYGELGRNRNKANTFIHDFHDKVRHWLTDVYFRQLALATGSFSMRVGSSEAIANVFRLGAKEYTKGWLSNKVAKGIAEAVKTQERKVVVSEEERNIIMQMVYDTLQAIHAPIKRAGQEFALGAVKGLELDKFVERLAKDTYERNGQLWGITAAHHLVDEYGAFHNLATGNGTGTWVPQSTVDDRYLAGLTKALNDRTESRVSRSVAEVLSRNLSRKTADLQGLSFAERVELSRKEARTAVENIIKQDPKNYANMLRLNGDFVNLSTFRRIERKIKEEMGVEEISSQIARNRLAAELNKVDAIQEYANALVDDLLWLSHGQGKVAGKTFSSDDVADKAFHPHVLNLIASGKMYRDPQKIRDLYLNPTFEQARTNYRRINARAKSVEPMSYHAAYYDPTWDPNDLSTLSQEERTHFNVSDFTAAPNEARKNPDWYRSEIRRMIEESAAPKRIGVSKKFYGKSKGSINRSYDDTMGEITERFPGNVPVQEEINPTNKIEALASASIGKFANTVHSVISEPVINSLSRGPLYATELNRQLDVLEPMVKAGTITEDTAIVVARQRAIEHAIKYIHNPQDRFVLEQWSRGFAPFWFAKNQALRRAGRLALTDPARFEQYVRSMLMMQEYGARSIQNSEDNSALLVPGSIMGGKLTTHFLHALGLAPAGGVPIGLTGSTSSLASVFPWTDPSGMNTGNATSLAESMRPDFGPMVSLPVRMIAMGNPYSKGIQEFNDLALGHIGSQSSMFQQLVPNSLARSLIAMGSSEIFGAHNSITNSIDALQVGLISQALEDRHRQLYNKALAEANDDYESYFAGAENPPNRNHWVDTIANAYVNEGIYKNGKLVQQPISYYVIDPTERQHLINQTHQAAIALYAGRTALSFFSPLSLSTTQVNPEMVKLVRDAQATNGDFTKAEKLFWKHPEAIYYAIHRTASEAGVPLPATLDMAKFQQDNADLFQRGGLSSGLIAFVPYSKEGDKFDSHEYHAQLGAGLRRKLTDSELMNSMARVIGNNYAFNYLPTMVDKVFNGNQTILKQSRSYYAKGNPLWAKTLGDSGKSRITALEQVRRVLDIENLNNRSGFKTTAPLVREIVGKYDEFARRYQNADAGYHDYVETQWETWLDEYVKAHPEVSIGANAIFRGLKLRDNK